MSNTDGVVEPSEVAARRGDDLFVLDVRNRDDYAEWRIDESHNLPVYDQLLDENFAGLEASLDEIPDDTEVAVVCVAGVTSARAADFLRDRGYDARSLRDGMRGWGRLHRSFDTDVAGVTQVVRPGTGCLSYLLADDGEALVVDPSSYVDEYLDRADDRDLDVVGVVDTHAHADHVSGARRLADERDVPYYVHEADSGSVAEYTPIADGDAIGVGDRTVEVLHTPGHTPGSVSLRFGDGLLSGDTLFVRSVGRPDLEDDDPAAVRDAAADLFESLDRLAALPEDTVVLPAHFSDEEVRPVATTLGDLEARNHAFDVADRGEFVESVAGDLPETPANYQRIKHVNWGEAPVTDDVVSLELGPNNCAVN